MDPSVSIRPSIRKLTVRSALKKLEKDGRDHLAETGITRWEHTLHVLEMIALLCYAILLSIPHAIHPGLLPGAARDVAFNKMLERQRRIRPGFMEGLE